MTITAVNDRAGRKRTGRRDQPGHGKADRAHGDRRRGLGAHLRCRDRAGARHVDRAAPSLTYTPAANYNGPDSFAFKANDGAADSNVATVSITVNAVQTPDFSLAVSPSTQTLTAGTNTTFSATVSPSGGFVGTVALTASGLPSGVTASFNPASVTTSGSSTMTVTSTAATPPGSYPFTVTGTSGSRVHTAALNVIVQSAALTVDQVVFSDGSGTRTTPTFSTASTTCSWPDSSAKRFGRHLRARTW